MSVERKRYECSALPKGWQREEVLRKSGLSAGKVDVYYYSKMDKRTTVKGKKTLILSAKRKKRRPPTEAYANIRRSPDGRKVRSKPQLARCLGDVIDYGSFDFRSGKVNNLLLRKQRKQRSTQVEYSRGVRNDASLVPPIRQTASIFKQPVTVYKTQEGKVKSDFKHGPQEKPKQLFWEKRLEGLRACDVDGHELCAMELPRGLRAVGPHVTEETLLQSVATALHVSSQPVTGQTGSRTNLDKNPGVFINPDQPLVQALAVGDEDIKRQEDRVNSARVKLQEAIKAMTA